jgi:hypothetical protein
MSTEKQRQHYVPKLYLRQFSYNENGKQIGVFNTNNSFFKADAKLKTQAYKPFFYGKDGSIENELANVEDEIAPLLTSIRANNEVPAFNTQERLRLLHFIILMSVRNPMASEEVIESGKQLRKTISDMSGGMAEIDAAEMMNSEEAVQMVLQQLAMYVTSCTDLKTKLILNQTETPFITSDNPVVKYNQFLEQRKWPGGITGYGSVGLQLFLPIDTQRLLLFYDDSIYKVGGRRKKILDLKNPTDIDQINLLQFLNCKSILFFNEKASEPYLNMLLHQSKRYRKANLKVTEIYPLIIQSADGEEMDQIIRQGTTDCKINLTIEHLSFTKKAKHHVLSKSAAQLRPRANQLMDLFHGNEIKKYQFNQAPTRPQP